MKSVPDMMGPMEAPTPALEPSRRRLDAVLQALLGVVLLVSVAAAICLWTVEGGLWQAGEPIRQGSKLRLAVLGLFFYPAKTLIQTRFASRSRQVVWYVALSCIVILFVWFRLTNWDWFPPTTTFKAKLYGAPIAVLFVPSAFFVYDSWSADRRRTCAFLMARVLVELALMYTWLYVWSFIMLELGWLWI